jgi:CTP-dependent riboflavin kinase
MSTQVIRVRGVVRSGKGDFSYWIEKLSDHYLRKTGLRFFPGTVNVHLLEAAYRFLQRHVIRLEGAEYGGEVNVSILPCRVFDRLAYVLRTDNDDGKHGDPPEAILEIASDVQLRLTYGLNDGDIIEVTLPAE